MEYQQKMRDDLERQAKQEEDAARVAAGGKVTDLGGKRVATKALKVVSLSKEDVEGNGSDSDDAAAKRRRCRTGGEAPAAAATGEASAVVAALVCARRWC